MGRSATAVVLFLALGFCAETFGYLSRPFNTLLGFVFLVLFLGQYVSRRVLPGFRTRWPGWLLAAVALVGALCWTGWIRVLLVSLVVGGVRWSRSEEEGDAADLRVFQVTAFAYGLFLWWWHETASGWYVLDGAASGLAWMAHRLGLNATLGPTAYGIPGSVLLFMYGATYALAKAQHRVRRIVALFAWLLAVQLAVAALHVAASAALSVSVTLHQGPSAGPPWYPFGFLRYLYPNNLQGTAFLLGLMPTLILTRTPLPVNAEEKPAGTRRWATNAGAWALLAGAALYGFVPPRPAAKGEILLHDAGYLDWRMPTFESYGDKSGGMFGRLPGFLQASGYHVKRRPASQESLRSAKVLVVINLMEEFDRPTKEAIWDFVRGGGGLLVLGDHTGVRGIREPSNDLLNPVHIALNFDSAKAFRDGWLWAYGLPRHAATTGMDDAINEIEIWIGASLAVGPPARPVIIGSYGFSDPGNMADQQRGYLGNLQYDLGERLGDIPLAAECRYGKGKVLVFGDTSPFQNGALVYSHRFVENVFAWLGSVQDPAADAARHWTGALLLLAGSAALAGLARMRYWPAVAAIALLLGWALGALPARALGAPSTAQNDVAWIDSSHLERFSLNSWVDDGFGGLVHNLMRNGYSPLLMTHWDTRELRRGALLILIGPSKPFSPREAAAIRQFVEGGGHLILAAGWEDLSGSEELWREFGLQVGQMPLGRVLVKQPGGDVRLYKGWPVTATQGHPEVLCSPWSHPAIVRLPIGKGSVVAIADTQFLLGRNLEGTERYYPENVAFLRRLFGELRNGRTEEPGTGGDRRPSLSGEGRHVERSLAQEGGK